MGDPMTTLVWSIFELSYTYKRKEILDIIVALLLLLSNCYYTKIPSSWAQTTGEKEVAVEIMGIEERDIYNKSTKVVKYFARSNCFQ